MAEMMEKLEVFWEGLIVLMLSSILLLNLH